jgi:hypothetical protein
MSTKSDFGAKYGPWAVVTGASDGIGRAFTKALAQDGLNLVLVARRADALNALAAALRTEHNVEATVVAADLSNPAGVDAVIDATRTLPVGLLVASAGFGTAGAFVELDRQNELNMIDVNCNALVALSHEFGGRFAQQGRGGLILLSSLVAFQGVARTATYAATKAFVQSFAEGLAIELAPKGVDVLACAPGPVATGFATRARMTMGATISPEQVATASLQALGRKGTVFPGALTRVLNLGLAFAPRFLRARIMSQVMRGMTQGI